MVRKLHGREMEDSEPEGHPGDSSTKVHKVQLRISLKLRRLSTLVLHGPPKGELAGPSTSVAVHCRLTLVSETNSTSEKHVLTVPMCSY